MPMCWVCFRVYHVVVSTEGKMHESEQLLNEERSVLSSLVTDKWCILSSRDFWFFINVYIWQKF